MKTRQKLKIKSNYLQMIKFSIICYLIVIAGNSGAFASDIIGGSLTYQYSSGNLYAIQLELFQDCVTTPSSSVNIVVTDGSGNPTSLNFSMPLNSTTPFTTIIDSCSGNPTPCIEKNIYSAIISLPNSPNGYHIFYQENGRTSNISNIYMPQLTGSSYSTYIPSLQLTTNSSPQWQGNFESYICVSSAVQIDFSANDSDGDSLVYSFYTPYNNTPPIFTSLSIPNNIQFNPIIWNSGYAANHPFNTSGTPFTINPQTGILSGNAVNLGDYLVGIKCEEYRNGVKIGQINMDFVFTVKTCPTSQTAIIGNLNGCTGPIIQMKNISQPWATNFEWNFGDGSPSVTGYEPTHTFPSDGGYTITLVSNVGTPCADTTTTFLKIGQVFANFISPDTICLGDTIHLVPSSTTSGYLIPDSWQWNFGDGSPMNTVFNPDYIYNSTGTFNINLVVGTDENCYGIINKTIYVQDIPTITTVADTFACLSNPVLTLNAQTVGAIGIVWQGNGGNITPGPTNTTIQYTPSATEIANGSTNILINTIGNGYCPSAQENIQIDYVDSAQIDIGYNINACLSTDSIAITANVNYALSMLWYTTNGTGTFNNSSNPLTFYHPSTADLNADSIQIIGKTIGGCQLNADSIWIKFHPPISTNVLSSTSICEGTSISFYGNSSTGSGVWSTYGDGVFSADTANITSYQHGAGDFAQRNVVIYFKTINNLGCPPQYDTISIAINANPSADFIFNNVCFGLPTTFQDNSYSEDPIISYKWLVDHIYFSSSQNTSFILSNDTIIPISLLIKTINGCTDTITKNVKPLSVPNADFSFIGNCTNEITSFNDLTTINGVNAVIDWKWDFDDSYNDTIQNPIHNFLSAGSYNVTLITIANNGCKDTTQNTITIFDAPIANFNYTPPTPYVGETIDFIDNSYSSNSILGWNWNFDNLYYDTLQNPNYAFNNTGEFTVRLIISDKNNCLDTTQQKIKIVNRYFEPNIPTAFSPNGDGNNDLFKIYGGAYKAMIFRVYNNWGQLVFETNNPNKGWNGKYKEKLQPVGVYVWTMEIDTYEGTVHKLNGNLTLMR